MGRLEKSESSSTISEPKGQPKIRDCAWGWYEFEVEVDHGMDGNNPDGFHNCLECLYCNTLICEVE